MIGKKMTDNFSEGKKLTSEMIKQFIKANQFDKLLALISKAEQYQVANSIFNSAYKKTGGYLIDKKRFDEAIIVLNKVRLRDYKSKSVFKSFVNAVDLFFKQNVEEFSKHDLEEYKQALLPIINFHKVNFPEHRQIIDSTDHLFRRIDYRIKYVANDVEETKVTYRVNEIKDSLYSTMSPQEIKDEFARIIEDDLRDLIKQKESLKKKKKNAKKRKKND